jgi:orotidine-5'-phosphate decarboxylase
MTRAELAEQIKAKGSFLCVGLDTDLDKIPQHLLASEDPQFEFNKQIIEATRDYCVAYKPNTAFYEAQGVRRPICGRTARTILALPMLNAET